MKRIFALVLAGMLVLCGCGGKTQPEQSGAPEGKTLTGTLEEKKDFMFIVTDDAGNSYAFDLDGTTPEGLDSCSAGDQVTVTYTGELSVVDSFQGTVICVKPAEGA